MSYFNINLPIFKLDNGKYEYQIRVKRFGLMLEHL